MKRWILLVLSVVLLLAIPRGFVTRDEICRDCGRIRRSEQFWVGSEKWCWDVSSSDVLDTEAARFIRQIGTPAAVHVWRPTKAARKAGRAIPQEALLVPLDRGIAWDAVRARLRNPRWDAEDPPWYARALGWPPTDNQEAKAWWAGVAERGGAFSH